MLPTQKNADAASAGRSDSHQSASFFAHHGLWAPGVRLFRLLGFRAKAALIAVAFLVPLSLLMTQSLMRSHAEILALELEISGAELLAKLAPIELAVADMRNGTRASGAGFADAGPTIDRARKVLDLAVAELTKHSGKDRSQLALVSEIKALQASAADLETKPSTQGIEAVLARTRELSSAVVNQSGLILDTDLVDLHLVLLYAEEIPRLAEAMGQLRGWGTAVLAAHQADSPAIFRTVGWSARAEGHLASIRENLKVVKRHAPERFSKLKLEWLDDADDYIKQSQKLVQGGKDMQAAEWFNRGSGLVERAYGSVKVASPILLGGLNSRAQEMRAQRAVIMVVTALSLLLAVYLFRSFFLVMDGGLREVDRHMKAMTAGNLAESPRPWGRDELAQLMDSMAEMQQSLRDMVSRVRASSDHILHSSSEISEGTLDLSARTEQTAANLEETASAMEEISSTVKHTAEYAMQATEIAEHNATVASRGGAVIGQMVKTMEDIHASSNRINDIIGVIDGIAFQTNILALNAAVEAARAGEVGRGFAVVASEVRALAQRSAGAAREIKGLIGTSVDQVERGSRVVREAGSTMNDIVMGAARVKELLGDIATGAREQSLGVGQVGLAVQELDRSTQQNAALVEQTAAAAASLRALAEGLADRVANFELPSGENLVPVETATQQITDFDFDGAIEAHRAWKVKLRQAIAKKEKLDAETICRDDACNLGRWLHGPGKQKWGSRPVFVDLVDNHAIFHKSAGSVARTINGGNYQDAERMIGSGSAFGQASNAVSMLLTQAKRGL